jgi:hypothetical protein
MFAFLHNTYTKFIFKMLKLLAQIRRKYMSVPAPAGIIEPSEWHRRFEKPWW